ncbi:glycoside hydrolase family 76 protein [Pseudopedobacter beijingensis]|uniref:Glycoside hydrolase family 76 protein n=1 Tax=Pseudopedobacter beijingensis TaxID=1207056 RepID=A0ABW4IFM4_9SPHI
MIFKEITLCALVLLVTGFVSAQESKYIDRVKKIDHAVKVYLKANKTSLYYETTDSSKNENKHSWLWPLCAYLQATNEMEVLFPGSNAMKSAMKAVDKYWANTKPVPAYQDYVNKEKITTKYYDDNEWVAITYLDAYKRNAKKKYLKEAKKIYNFILFGLDSVTGGGIYWREKDMTTKNTCSNGPGILVALRLYQQNPKPEYLKTAIDVYNWTKSRLQSPEGIYWDHIQIPSLKINKDTYTYNTGTMLQSAVILYNITKDAKYLEEAKLLAKAGKAHFFKNKRLPNEYWFNAVMLRGYIELYKIDKNTEWIDFFKIDADEIWDKERNEQNLLGTRSEKRLIDQGAMIEIYALLAQAEQL